MRSLHVCESQGQTPARSGNGKSFFIEEFFDLQDEIKIFPPVEPLKRTPLMGFDDFKFRFPVTKHMGFETRDAAYLSDPIVEPFMGDGALNLIPFE